MIVGSVVEWLKRRDRDQHGLGSKPTRAILLCPWERLFTALSWWSWQAVLNYSHISIRLQADSNILASPKQVGVIANSGGYSNLGARGKNFQKFMLSEKKKRSDLGLDIFLPKSKCSLKKKKGLHSKSSTERIQNCICCFRGGALKIEGGPEATASFASPNIHH